MENETTGKSAIGDCTGAVGHGYKKKRRGRGKSALLLDIRCSSLMFININNKTILICNDDLACQPTVDAYLPQPIVDYMSRTVAIRVGILSLKTLKDPSVMISPASYVSSKPASLFHFIFTILVPT